MLYPNELVIGDHNAHLYARDVTAGGERKSRGLVPRDYTTHPLGTYPGEVGMRDVEMPVIPRAEWSERIRDQIAQGRRLSDFRAKGGPGGGVVPARDQNGKGYCWAHSGVSAMMLVRARDDMPYVDLSAYAVACTIKGYRDEGGWGAQGLDFLMQKGVPSSAFWAQQSMNRANDRPETWENAALHRFTEGWVDTGAAQYDRKVSFEQEVTAHLVCDPSVNDYNWWSHSVCGMDVVDGVSLRDSCRSESGKLMSSGEFDATWAVDDPVTGGFGIRILNSWGDSWSEQGSGVLTGTKCVADGGAIPRVATWSGK